MPESVIIRDILIILVPPFISAIAVLIGAIYYNRRQSNKLYQRLFGLDDDNIDDGYMNKMESKLTTMDGKLDELNHQRIENVEIKLDALENQLEDIDKRLIREEETDEKWKKEDSEEEE